MTEEYGNCMECAHELYGKCYVKTSRDNFYAQTGGEWADGTGCRNFWYRNKSGKEIDRMRATKQEAEREGCSAESLDAAAAAVRRYERCLKDMKNGSKRWTTTRREHMKTDFVQ